MRSFLFFCRPELEQQVKALAAPFEEQVPRRIATAVDNLLYQAIVDPPLALFLELSTSLRFSAAQRAALLSLGVRWPIVRYVYRGDGNAAILGSPPAFLASDWTTMAGEVADGSSKWDHPVYRREHVRLAVRCRCRVRRPREAWHPGHTLDLGVNGAFILTYDTWAEGDDIEAELLDFLPEPLVLRGKVVTFRGWDRSAEFPGIGVQFATETPHESLARQLSKIDYLTWPKLLAPSEF